VPEGPPRPPFGPESVPSFLDFVTSKDGVFEVIVGQGRIVTLKESLAVRGKVEPFIAIGDPTVLDFTVVSPRQIRVLGRRVGVSDLSITTASGQSYNFEIRVVPDLDVLRAKLRCLFPDASLKLTALRDHVVVEGQARDAAQVSRILQTIEAYLESVRVAQTGQVAATGGAAGPTGRRNGALEMPRKDKEPGKAPEKEPEKEKEGVKAVSAQIITRPGEPITPPIPIPAGTEPYEAPIVGTDPLSLRVTATVARPQVINLIRVPGSQQVLLKVRIAEMNRTAMRQIGADWIVVNHNTGLIQGTQIGGANIAGVGTVGPGLNPPRGGTVSTQTTLFGIFEPGDFQYFLSALRRNSLLKVLAEPNLICLNGHQASFLAGGEFPVPVPQVGASGVAPTITVQFKEFGVRLGFVPFILDGDVIRLTVDPEVSNIDRALSTTLVAGGSPVPGLDTRKAHTVVEMRQGQTLAIAGLLQLTLDGTTQRIPLLGDLPFLGPFFSNTTGERVEKELLVLVTPYLVEPSNPDQVPPTPGDEVNEPTDLEFYLLNRIQGRTGRDHRSTVKYDDPLYVIRCFLKMHKDHVQGPHGFCD
jgi:pilus assembly protein CpaC